MTLQYHISCYLKEQGYTTCTKGAYPRTYLEVQTDPNTFYATQLYFDDTLIHVFHCSDGETIDLIDPDSLERLTQVLDRMECTKQSTTSSLST